MDPQHLQLLDKLPGAWSIFLPVFLVANLVTGLLYVISKKTGFMVRSIRDRDVHTVRKPRVGGAAMWLTVLGAILIIGFGSQRGLLNFGGPTLWGLDQVVWGIIAAMAVIFAFGVLDDLYNLSPGKQLLGQFLAATALIIGGLKVSLIRLPFDGALHLDAWSLQLPSYLGGAEVWVWSALFVYLWVIVMINVMNFFDGLDGLTGSVAMVSSVVLLLVSLRIDFIGAAVLCLILFGTTAGFLPWNWHPSKLFMGTVGSQLLGMLLAVIAIISGAKVATAVLVLGIPILDAFIVIVRRLAARQNPFTADQRHLHHRLLKIGIPTPWVVVIVNAVVLFFGVLALGTQQTNTKGLLTLALAGCMGLFVFITYLLERRATRRVH